MKAEIQNKLQEVHHSLCTSDRDLDMDEPFREQGYDSLDQVEFFICVEKKLNISMSDEKLVDITTPAQLVELIIFQTHLTQAPDLTI